MWVLTPIGNFVRFAALFLAFGGYLCYRCVPYFVFCGPVVGGLLRCQRLVMLVFVVWFHRGGLLVGTRC